MRQNAGLRISPRLRVRHRGKRGIRTILFATAAEAPDLEGWFSPTLFEATAQKSPLSESDSYCLGTKNLTHTGSAPDCPTSSILLGFPPFASSTSRKIT